MISPFVSLCEFMWMKLATGTKNYFIACIKSIILEKVQVYPRKSFASDGLESNVINKLELLLWN